MDKWESERVRCSVCGKLVKPTKAQTVTAHYRFKTNRGRQYGPGDYCAGGGRPPGLRVESDNQGT